ncbi:MAG: hypothetical protein AAF705_11640 [Bacteroidota bacterium]
MRISIIFALFLLTIFSVKGQNINTDWYSESTSKGITIQNSYPRGGRYPGTVNKHFNYSYLVFFTRIINETESTFEIDINFSADPIAIPNSPNAFMKVFLPADTMTLEKRSIPSYGINELASLDEPTRFQRKVKPGEDCLFYSVAIFYQTTAGDWIQERGGNRAELILEGQDLYYNILPQLDALPCGKIVFNK